MEHPPKRLSENVTAPSTGRTSERARARGAGLATDRIPDCVALLSYGTPVLGRFGGGPRLI
jgi:hypothetical protein